MIAIACFWTGLIGSALAGAWYLTVLLTRRPMWPLPSDIVWIEVLFAFWGTVMFATFYRSPRPIWTPLVAITGERVQWARLLLASAVLNGLVWLLGIVGLSLAHVHEPLPWLFCLLASSCGLLNGLYVCVHWALRPESVFSERFRRFADDPVVFAVVEMFKRRRRIK